MGAYTRLVFCHFAALSYGHSVPGDNLYHRPLAAVRNYCASHKRTETHANENGISDTIGLSSWVPCKVNHNLVKADHHYNRHVPTSALFAESILNVSCCPPVEEVI